MEEIAKIIRRQRLLQKMSQGRLASLSGVTTRTVLAIENGRKCSVQTLMALCETLGLEIIIKKKSV
jgi:transcriptional regulator with XRE-family HTH domain